MSLPIWTQAKLACELRSFEGKCWRFVEAQHVVSTLKLVDSLEEQAVLEELIEETKPDIPRECRDLDFLLATPFRYQATYRKGSRFRRAGRTLGVYYASERCETALAEMAFYRLLFFADSPATPWPNDAAEYTAFSAAVRTQRSLDLTLPPLLADRAFWVDTVHYEACQQFADTAREVTAELIRCESVRDPVAGANIAILTCTAFAEHRPVDRETWRMRLGAAGVQATREFPRLGIEFGRDNFGKDPRIASLNWQR